MTNRLNVLKRYFGLIILIYHILWEIVRAKSVFIAKIVKKQVKLVVNTTQKNARDTNHNIKKHRMGKHPGKMAIRIKTNQNLDNKSKISLQIRKSNHNTQDNLDQESKMGIIR